MTMSRRGQQSASGDTNTMTTVSGDTTIVGVAQWTSGTPTDLTFNGVSMIPVASVARAAAACGMWYLSNPPIGAYTLELVDAAAGGMGLYYYAGTSGEFLVPRSSATVSDHQDVRSIIIPTVATADFCAYIFKRASGGGSVGGADSSMSTGSNSRAAEEESQSPTAAASYGDELTSLADWTAVAAAFQIVPGQRAVGVVEV